jgi:hypothetical protein
MDFEVASPEGLLSMHRAIRDALKKDDETPANQEKVYGVRKSADWVKWRDGLEAELDRRGIIYTKVVW